MSINRKYELSKVFRMVDLPSGNQMLMYVFDNLTKDQVLRHFEWAMDNEDYEYAEECAAEARLRGFSVVS